MLQNPITNLIKLLKPTTNEPSLHDSNLGTKKVLWRSSVTIKSPEKILEKARAHAREHSISTCLRSRAWSLLPVKDDAVSSAHACCAPLPDGARTRRPPYSLEARGRAGRGADCGWINASLRTTSMWPRRIIFSSHACSSRLYASLAAAQPAMRLSFSDCGTAAHSLASRDCQSCKGRLS